VFELTLTKISEINMDTLRMFLKGLSSEYPEDPISVLDIVMRHRPSLRFTTVGRCFYTPEAAVTIPNGAQLWQGFHQSMHPTKGQMLVNLDVSATAFYEFGPLLEIISRVLNRKHFSELRNNLNDYDRGRVDRVIRGLKMVVTHRGQIRRKYKILRLTSTDCDKTEFCLNDTEEKISVSEFFKMKFGFELAFPYLPCVMVGDASRPAYFPVEVCEIVPGQRCLKKLNEAQVFIVYIDSRYDPIHMSAAPYQIEQNFGRNDTFATTR
jgi:eukaryotic translation initiation factor 2C